MRILVVMLSVGFAGTERHAVELANELTRQGHDVAMLLRRRPSGRHRQAPYRTLRSAVSPPVRVFQASRVLPVLALWRALLRFRPDVVHAHAERSVRIVARRTGRVPVVATVHQPFRGQCLMQCAGVICLTDAAARAMPSHYSGSLFVIGNWVGPHQRPADAVLAARRAAFGLGAHDYVVGTVARLEPEKGLDDLITAYHAADLPASRLVIVGDGTQRGELERRAARLGLGARVVFTGFRPDVRDLYYLFDAFVLSSLREAYGLAILEAAAANVPVIATATDGPRAIAEHLPVELVPIGSPAALAQALAKLHRKPVAASDMSAFSIEDRVHRIVDAYRQVLAATRRTPARHLATSLPG